jgi:23S rRNA (pseudouridine1915-N3)-methyltransferase
VRVVIAAVGKIRSPELAAVVKEYETRAARYWPLDVREVREQSSRSRPATQVRDAEGERLLSAAGTAATVVTCDPDGTLMTSEALATWLQRRREMAADVAFLIGGASGLSSALRERAALRLSFGRLTLAHELARLVLAEQLYRAGTIVRGEPYHK